LHPHNPFFNRENPGSALKNCLPQFFFQNGGCIFTKHTSFMLKNIINNVITNSATIIIVVVIIITSAGGGA